MYRFSVIRERVHKPKTISQSSFCKSCPQQQECPSLEYHYAIEERNSFDLQMFRRLLDTTFLSRARVKRTVSNVVIMVYAFPTIKMTAFDASVSMASQENLAVGIYPFT